MHISGSNFGRNLCILRNEKRFYKTVISIFRRRNAINYSVCVWIHMECTDSTKNKTKNKSNSMNSIKDNINKQNKVRHRKEASRKLNIR